MPNQESTKSYEFFAPKVFIRTFGCQMNVRDSEVIAGLLRQDGCVFVDNPDEADVVILNTCSVRQHAEDKVWSEIGRIIKSRTEHREPRTEHREPIIGIVGCMAQNYKEEAFKRAPSLDFVVGPSDIHKIPEIIRELMKERPRASQGNLFERKIWETEGQIRPPEIYHTGFYNEKEHAFVVISEGCSNFCSYCVVPYVRGPLRHRKAADILLEIQSALDKGIKDITLLGQNVNAYQFGVRSLEFGVDFVKLLEMVNKVKGMREFSFITSHPKYTSLDLFKVMADSGKLKKYLHLPAQTGSDRVLALMNRGYAQRFYLELIDKYRKIVKGAVLTTDIIVGFPTESEDDFKQTQMLVKRTEFDSAYIFKYSPRPRTEAEKLNDDVPKKEKERRHGLILELQKKISSKIKKLNVKHR